MGVRWAATGLCLTLVGLALGGCGLTASRNSEGYANFDSLGVQDVDNVMTLSIGPALLHLAANAVDDDPETRALLRQLEGVRIRIYQIDGDSMRVANRAERMQQGLRAQDWQPVAVVQRPGERVYMLLKMSGERICGLTVIAADHAEAVIVNIMGDLQPERFGATMAALNQDAPDVRVASSN